MNWRVLSVFLTVVGLISVVRADWYELPSGTHRALGGAVPMSDCSPADLLVVPSVTSDGPAVQLEFDYVRRFEMNELSDYTAIVAGKRGRFASVLGLAQFGSSELYREQTMRWVLAMALDSLCLSSSLSATWVSFGGDHPTRRAATIGLGASYHRSVWAIGITGDNLTRSRFGDKDPRSTPQFSLFAQYQDQGSFALVGRVIRQPGQQTRLALGQRLDLSSWAALLWGVQTEPFEYGGGLTLTYAGAKLTFASSYHSALGFTTAGGIVISVGSKGHSPLERR